MSEYRVNTSQLKELCTILKIGDKVYLSGTVYTARDAAHKRIMQMIEDGRELPFDIDGTSIYYAGPTPTPEGLSIGSCGPTTSSRMDKFAPILYNMGMTASIGKGDRSDSVYGSIVNNKAVYLCAIGGAGALACKCITDCQVIAFDDLGCESIKKLQFQDFPLIVGIDSNGSSLFKND